MRTDAARRCTRARETPQRCGYWMTGLAAAVKLSHRYLPDRQLPDKAVSVLDTACARLALGQNSLPAAIEDAHAHAGGSGRAETGSGAGSGCWVPTIRTPAAVDCGDEAAVEEKLAALQERWEKRTNAGGRDPGTPRGKLEDGARAGAEARRDGRDALAKLNAESIWTRCRARITTDLVSVWTNRSSAKSSPAGPASPSARC